MTPIARPRETLISQTREIIIRELGCDPSRVLPEARFVEDLGVDSLSVEEIRLHVEDAFTIEISDDDWDSINTVGELYAYVAQRVPS